jgi:hypothetical protein
LPADEQAPWKGNSITPQIIFVVINSIFFQKH